MEANTGARLRAELQHAVRRRCHARQGLGGRCRAEQALPDSQPGRSLEWLCLAHQLDAEAEYHARHPVLGDGRLAEGRLGSRRAAAAEWSLPYADRTLGWVQ